MSSYPTLVQDAETDQTCYVSAVRPGEAGTVAHAGIVAGAPVAAGCHHRASRPEDELDLGGKVNA